MVKNLPANARDLRDVSSIPGLGTFPAGGHGDPLQHSRLRNIEEAGGLQSVGSQKVRHN